MRYIGNKTRLLGFITGAIDRLGITPGTAHDAFAGTSAVGRALKERGWRVASSDLMTYSYVFQRAYVVAQRIPALTDLRATDADLRRAQRSAQFRERAAARGLRHLGAVAEYLERWLEPVDDFLTANFAGERMYFTSDNARRIDAVRGTLHRWHNAGLLSDDAFYLLLAALIEGADRVANTAGVYAAYIKSWQPNARRLLEVAPQLPWRGVPGSTAHRADATAAARSLGAIDLLYVDPPYNSRQYPGYYHVPELIARGWAVDPPSLRGKTGLLPSDGQRSDWCSARRVRQALRSLLEVTGARHVLVSYNSEGLLPERILRETLAEASIDGRVRTFRKTYRRYRADSDRAGRRYTADRVRELLVYARLRS
ncbi:MAG: DNA adenine methylase [Gemmatimonadaceae bacterium]